MLFLCEIKYFLKPHVRSQARWADRGLRREVWTVWGSESIRSSLLVGGRSLRSRNPGSAGFRWNGPAGELAWESAGCGSRAFGGSTCCALIGMGEQLGMGRGRRGLHCGHVKSYFLESIDPFPFISMTSLRRSARRRFANAAISRPPA